MGNYQDSYLDIIHKPVHDKQFMEGKELQDRHSSYVERPTEIEAYRYAVAEALNLGMDDNKIHQYFKTERMSEENLHLEKLVNVNLNEFPKSLFE